MWDRPEELVGRADVDKHIQEPPHKRGLEDSKKTGVEKHLHIMASDKIVLNIDVKLSVLLILMIIWNNCMSKDLKQSEV